MESVPGAGTYVCDTCGRCFRLPEGETLELHWEGRHPRVRCPGCRDTVTPPGPEPEADSGELAGGNSCPDARFFA